ncbi:MAG: DUF1343 domain-containing protein [Candidatus Rokubacteria bacterium]|nr:DUF1343 domain-containing protein [Candidatus Rokubacteria bacterium]
MSRPPWARLGLFLAPWVIGLAPATPVAVPALAEPATQSAEPAPGPGWAGLDEAVLDAVTAGEVPGAVIIVGQDDRILYRKAVGLRTTAPSSEPLTLDTIYDVASLTKVVATAPAVLALVEQRKIDLHAPLARYLPALARGPYRQVTVRQVLTHAAGFPDLPPKGALDRGLANALRVIAQTPAQFAPGTGFRYSDTGYILLGALVRRASGQSLDEFTRRRFYEPLRMADTRFEPPETWQPRIAPTEYGPDGGILRGVVHDGNARSLDGVAGHAGLFSTGDDLARFCRMLLGGGTLGGRRLLKRSTVQTMFTPYRVGEVSRALGWDIASPFSRNLGAFFPVGSAGHTGFTGTSIWMDPPTRTYVILLTNRVHPDGKGNVVDLRRRVHAAVGAALFGGAIPPPLDPWLEPAVAAVPAAGPATVSAGLPEPTRSGLDRLAADGWAPLLGRSVGLVTNHTGVDGQGRRGIDLLASAPGVKLKTLFSPEHGLGGELDAKVPHGRDAATGLPVYSLYGNERRPSAAMLAGLDTLVFDIQDVGVRYYTYLTTLVYILEEAGRRGLPVVVLDRPNPITGRAVEGPLMDPDLRSFTAPHEIPVRTGMTIGEFGQMVVGERRLPVRLTVIPLDRWGRSQWFDETGLPWVNPSPNIRSPRQALLYSGIGLLEATNLSVGRGTDMPFEVVGAPWITDPTSLARALDSLGLRGVSFQPIEFTPTANVYAGQPLGGVRMVVTNRDALETVAMALAVARMLSEQYPQHFRPAAIQNLLVNRATFWALHRNEPLSRVWSWAEADRPTFLRRRASYLLYP